MGLADKRVVILGGTSGIGLQVGKLAAAEGGHVVLASSSQTKVDRAKDAVPEAEGRTIDLLSQSNIKTFFRQDRRIRPSRLHGGRRSPDRTDGDPVA